MNRGAFSRARNRARRLRAFSFGAFMAGITLDEAQTHLTTWLEADKAVAKGQSFSISGKTYTRADAQVIRENIEFWDRYVKRLSRGGIKIFGGTPT